MDYLIFDLDGTLTDSSEGIINSIHFALDFYKVPLPSKAATAALIGPPLLQTFRDFLPQKVDPKDAVAKYREYFAKKGIYENALYPGVVPLLELLRSKNKKIALGTAKPTYFAKIVLDHFNLTPYFDVVVGSHLSGSRTDKAKIVYEIADQWGWPNQNSVVMIGDRASDIQGGKAHQFKTIGVSYGFAKNGELENAQADFLVDHIAEIEALIG